MSEARLGNTMREHRERARLSQQALADLVDVSRQAIIAIEQGRRVPSTVLSLRLARALGCTVESLFTLAPTEAVAARLVPTPARSGAPHPSEVRVALGEVGGAWVAHELPMNARLAATGLAERATGDAAAQVRPLLDTTRLRNNVMVAGCAPLLGALAEHVRSRFGDTGVTWLEATSNRAIDLLESRLVHVAGLHVFDAATGEDNVSVVRRRFADERMLVVNLTRWRQGLVVPAGNPLGMRSGADLLRPGLRFARREKGAGAEKLLSSLLAAEGVENPLLAGPLATGHEDVAFLVGCGAADVGVAIEGVALAAGLGFVPLVEERFDLVVPADLAGGTSVVRLLEALDDPGFRADAARLPGYDTQSCGHVTTLEAA